MHVKQFTNERKLELGMEGHRFFDLTRWDAYNGGPAGSIMTTEIEKLPEKYP
jgi:hypothetical protein